MWCCRGWPLLERGVRDLVEGTADGDVLAVKDLDKRGTVYHFRLFRSSRGWGAAGKQEMAGRSTWKDLNLQLQLAWQSGPALGVVSERAPATVCQSHTFLQRFFLFCSMTLKEIGSTWIPLPRSAKMNWYNQYRTTVQTQILHEIEAILSTSLVISAT